MVNEDVRAMQDVVGRAWSDRAFWHVGDLAWQWSQHVDAARPWRTRVWREGGDAVAWGWLDGDELNLCADGSYVDAVLDWAVDARSCLVSDRQDELAAALGRRGFVVADSPRYSAFTVHDLRDLPTPPLPEGFRLRSVTEADIERRVAVHRVVWEPSRVTVESYRNVMAAWPYRPELDWVVEAPDGRFAASCLVWLDEANRVAELEPVGTDPAFRGLGLASAVCLAGMRATRAAGADSAVVFPTVGDARSVGALPLYRSIGFRPYARSVRFVRG